MKVLRGSIQSIRTRHQRTPRCRRPSLPPGGRSLLRHPDGFRSVRPPTPVASGPRVCSSQERFRPLALRPVFISCNGASVLSAGRGRAGSFLYPRWSAVQHFSWPAFWLLRDRGADGSSCVGMHSALPSSEQRSCRGSQTLYLAGSFAPAKTAMLKAAPLGIDLPSRL